jgi:hypothetical protein
MAPARGQMTSSEASTARLQPRVAVPNTALTQRSGSALENKALKQRSGSALEKVVER